MDRLRMDRLQDVGLDDTARVFISLAMLSYSSKFVAMYAIPKLLVLSLGLLVMALMAVGGAPVNRGRSLLTEGGLVLGVMCLSFAFADDKWLAIVGNHNSYSLGFLGVLLAIGYHLAASGGRSLWPIPIVGAMMGVHAFYQWGLTDTGLTGNRAIGTIGSPVFLGMTLAAILPFALQSSLVYAAAVGLGLFASGSRGAWVAAVVGLLAWGITQKRKEAVWAAGLAAVLAVLSIPILGPRAYAKSDMERVAVWKVAARSVVERPILGHGPDGFANVYRRSIPREGGKDVAEDAHNDFLQAASTLGVVGVYAYAITAFMAISWVAGPGIGSMVSLFANLKFNPIALEVMVLGAVICGACLSGEPEKNPIPKLVALLVLVVAIGIAGLSARLARADSLAGGGLASVLEAAKINPYELSYKAKAFNLGVQEFNASKDVRIKEAIINELDKQADSAIKNRANSPLAQEIYSKMQSVKKKVAL